MKVNVRSSVLQLIDNAFFRSACSPRSARAAALSLIEQLCSIVTIICAVDAECPLLCLEARIIRGVNVECPSA